MTKGESGSFRDPSGFVYFKNNKVLRQINPVYHPQYQHLMLSGLYDNLVNNNLLIKHKEVENNSQKIIIEHERIPVINYPYEWSFNQLKDAALITLNIAKIALKHDAILKDASAYNIQFVGTHPIFIDTLSFDFYKEGELWIAYKQFCQHFLAPLSLMTTRDLRLNILLRDFIDGIPLDMASKLLPKSSRLNFALLTHIHLHAQNQKRMASKKIQKGSYKMSKFQMNALLSNLESAIKKLNVNKSSTQWDKYYTFTNYSKKAEVSKQNTVLKYLKQIKPKKVIDLGANNGKYSKIASNLGSYTIAADSDPLAINFCYMENKNNKKLLPLVLDLTNPSPAIGWANNERVSARDRYQVDCVMSLALIHHLAIGNNLPFGMIADFFKNLGEFLIIEFVPKEDSKVKILLQNRVDIFVDYDKNGFESSFTRYYRIIKSDKVTDSNRILYLMKKK
jgi:hypothetical protein